MPIDPPVPGSVASAMSEALTRYSQLRAQGMPFEDACTLLEAGLRAAFPGSTDDGPLVCAACHDTGFEPVMRWMRIYQEHRRAVRFCECSKGRAMREAYERQEADRDAVRYRRTEGLTGAVAAFRRKRR